MQLEINEELDDASACESADELDADNIVYRLLANVCFIFFYITLN